MAETDEFKIEYEIVACRQWDFIYYIYRDDKLFEIIILLA